MKLSHILWMFPFICFIGTYVCLYRYYGTEKLITPAVIGKSITEVILVLSSHNLNVRILQEKEDSDVPEGTVVSQIPAAGQTIKPHQSLFLVISKKKQYTVPALVGKSLQESMSLAHKEHMSLKTFVVPSHNPEGTCVGQFPQFGHAVYEPKITAYISTGNNKPFVMPSFKNNHVREVLDFLKPYPCKVVMSHTSPIDAGHQCRTCIITDQKPLAGSLVIMKPSLTIYVQAST